MQKLLFRSVSGAALAFVCVTAAQAQESAPTDVEGIVITGEKAQRSLQETTTSVAVTTAARIENETIQTLSEVFNRTANMSETYGSATYTIRGINNRGVSGGGAAGLATIYLDGVALPERITHSAPTDTWDLAQIEILRGPQSTLQGRNALAGSIVMRTQDPTFDWDLRARAMWSDADETSFAFAGGGPLIADQLAFRVAVEKRDADGFIYNPTRKTDETALDALIARAKLLWTPTAIPDLTVRLGYTYSDRTGGYMYNYASLNEPDLYKHPRNFSDEPNTTDSRTNLLSLEATYALSDRFELTSVTAWSKADYLNSRDSDFTAAPQGATTADETYETLTQEFRVNYTGDRLQGLVGLYVSNRDERADGWGKAAVQTPVATIAALLRGAGFPSGQATAVANMYFAALPIIPVQTTSANTAEIDTIAVFGDGRYQLTDQLSLLAGFRYDREESTTTDRQTASFAGTYPNPAAFGAPGSPLYMAIAAINQGVAGLVAQANGSNPGETRDFEAFLPKLGLRYDWNDDLGAAFVVQRGYRSGGSSFNIARTEMHAYDPEYTWNYELSFRSRWLDGALSVNANAFYIDWEDQQVSVNLGLNLYDYHTVNAGKSHLYGFEVETAHKVSSVFDWYASLGHVRTEFDEFVVPGANNNLSGSEFSYAPHWTLAGGANWRWGDGFIANLNASYRSEVYTTSGVNQEATKVSARTLVNGQIAYEADHWKLTLFGKNLLNEEYLQYQAPTIGMGIIGDPRVVGVSLETRW